MVGQSIIVLHEQTLRPLQGDISGYTLTYHHLLPKSPSLHGAFVCCVWLSLSQAN